MAAGLLQNAKGRTTDGAEMKLTAIDKAFGVAESTGQGKAKAIRDLLKIRQFDFHWMLRQRIEESPMAWMIQVNGFLVDARHLRKEVQEAARLWWREEIRDAERFLEARIRQQGAVDQMQEADGEVAKITCWKDRPVLKDVLAIIEKAEKGAGFE